MNVSLQGTFSESRRSLLNIFLDSSLVLFRLCRQVYLFGHYNIPAAGVSIYKQTRQSGLHPLFIDFCCTLFKVRTIHWENYSRSQLSCGKLLKSVQRQNMIKKMSGISHCLEYFHFLR